MGSGNTCAIPLGGTAALACPKETHFRIEPSTHGKDSPTCVWKTWRARNASAVQNLKDRRFDLYEPRWRLH